MKRIMIAAAAAAAMMAGVGAANAQTFYGDGYAYGDGYYGRPLVERGVGLQIGPVGVYTEPGYTYERPLNFRDRRFRGDDWHSTYNTRAFRSQEWLPQSPPAGGY